ncbi:MAG: helix-turn-helix transcriptional regulator [Pseudomonadota bacterium]|nr:helix-turn-helix transcriptional regulator [Pseudomonadota bacterium]
MNYENYHAGSNFDNFLEEEGILYEVEAAAMKKIIAFQIEKAMQEQHISKTEMARRMRTSRAAVDRLIDPNSTSVTFITIAKAAAALGMRFNIMLDKTAVV